MSISANNPGYHTGPYDSASMSAVSTVFDAFDRAVGEAPPTDRAGTGAASSVSPGSDGPSSTPKGAKTSGGAGVPGDGTAAGAPRLPKVSGGDGDSLSHTIESRVYAEERHVVDINVALPKGTRLRQKGSARGVTIHTGYGTAKP